MSQRSRIGRSALIAAAVLSLTTATQLLAQEETAANTDEIPPAEGANFTLYVSIDELKRELDRGADLVLLDARSRPDYLFDHITGAMSMPFFEVEERFAELPKDKWIIAYCACPRAEAENAVRVLQTQGFDKVAVMYEGYFEWRDRGYPITSGDHN
jgi:rhodanese-related sulfurtransferase